MTRGVVLLFGLALFGDSVNAQDTHYAGSEVCTPCHRAIAESQARTAMARTWQGNSPAFAESKFEEGNDQIHYRVRREGSRAHFSVAAAGLDPLTLPVASMIGGKRHGISLLLKVSELGGVALERPALVEARYALLPNGTFVLSPGFPTESPRDLEHALGRVLSPGFETRCLTCHGKPGTLGAGKEGGVQCESCHGPASAHVAQPAIVKLPSLKGSAAMGVCAQCHSGFKPGSHFDPVPEDLLVSSQVPALRHSECFIQSGEQLTCTDCHNPHQDSAALAQSSVTVCLRCHSLSATGHAAICPVNRSQGCTGCHMPAAQVNSFRVANHWIRVPPGSASAPHTQDPAFRSQVIPKREFLRLIAVPTEDDMKVVTGRLAQGESFSSVAHALSKDQSAAAGGFIGDTVLADMDPALSAAAAQLAHNADSGVMRVGDSFVLLHRLSRDFKWTADRLYHEALQLNQQGDRAQAIKKAKEALDTYPYQLRGLNLSGVMLRQAGDMSHALAFLGFAAQMYPRDAPTQFNLALIQNSPSQTDQLRHVLELDSDILAVYEKLGTLLEGSGQPAAAIETFRAGLTIDPLSAALYYDLGLALREQGHGKEAANALALAERIDPKLAAQRGH